MNPDAIAVTGVGMITPAGPDTASTWDGLCSGISTAAPDPDLVGLPISFSCQATAFDAEHLLGRQLTWRLDRFIHLALAAARQAVAHAHLDPARWEPTRVGIVLGTGGNSSADTQFDLCTKLIEDRYKSVSPTAISRSAPNMAAGEISLDLGIQGPGLTVSTACSSGATALSLARDLLRAGTCDIVLAGGTDVGRNRSGAIGFDRMRALSRRTHDPAGASRPFDADRDGFVLGEGAAVLVLENAGHARSRRAPVHAYLAGTAITSEAHHPTAPTPDGSGAARAMRLALAQAGLAPEDIDHVNAHGSSTKANDLAEARALRAVFRTPPPVTAVKSVIGHSIGAAGAIEAAVSVLSLIHQQIPPTANLDRLDPEIDLDLVTKTTRHLPLRTVLSNSFGFGGQNAALLFTTTAVAGPRSTG